MNRVDFPTLGLPTIAIIGFIKAPDQPLYDRLLKEGRLTRPKHWLEFAPLHMAHTPLKMSIPEVQAEVRYAWENSYSPAATARALDSIAAEPAAYKISHLAARIFFRGIYFPPKGVWGWLKVVAQNRASILRVLRECFTKWNGAAASKPSLEFEPVPQPQETPGSE